MSLVSICSRAHAHAHGHAYISCSCPMTLPTIRSTFNLQPSTRGIATATDLYLLGPTSFM